MLSVDFGFAKTSSEEKKNADEAVAVVCKKFLRFNFCDIIFYEPNIRIGVKLSLRRTLVLFNYYSTAMIYYHL